MITHYKVRHKVTGWYNKGTLYNQWHKVGKTYDTLGKLRAFLTRCFNDDYMRKFIPEFEIVELQVREGAVKDVHEVIDPKKLLGLLSKKEYD